MDGPPTLRDDELAAQTTVLLPARETLLTINVAPVIGVNVSLAINAASINASASSMAAQQLSGLHY